jgi:hypothetical protein
MQRRVIRWKSTNVSEEHVASSSVSKNKPRKKPAWNRTGSRATVLLLFRKRRSRNDVKTHQAFRSEATFSLSIFVITVLSFRWWNMFVRAVIQCPVCSCIHILKVFPNISYDLRQPIRGSRKNEPLLLTGMSLDVIRRDRQVTSLRRVR